MTTRAKELRRTKMRAARDYDGWDRGCSGKAQYANRGKAREGMARLRKKPSFRRGGRPMQVYRCRRCGSWHVGHQRSTRP